MTFWFHRQWTISNLQNRNIWWRFSLPADVPWCSFVTQPQKDVCGEANADSEGLNSRLKAKQNSIHDINIVLPWESDQEEAPGPDHSLERKGARSHVSLSACQAGYLIKVLLFRDPQPPQAGAPNVNFRICSEDVLRSRIFGTFVVKFLACLPLLGFSNIWKML